jgi:hypothetical protein
MAKCYLFTAITELIDVNMGYTITCCPTLRSAAEIVFTRSMVTVIGPTPPGTGVIREAFLDTPLNSTSPTICPELRRLIPTSMTIASVRTGEVLGLLEKGLGCTLA